MQGFLLLGLTVSLSCPFCPRPVAQESLTGAELRAALKSEDVKVRTLAAKLLQSYDFTADPQMVDAALPALKDSDPEIRRLVACALFRAYKTRTAMEVVAALLDVAKSDKDKKVREAAMGSLGAFGPQAKAAVPMLLKALDDKDAAAKERALDILVQIDLSDEDAARRIVKLLNDPDVSVRATAAGYLSSAVSKGYHKKVAVPALIEALKDQEARVRTPAIDAVGFAGADGAPALKQLQAMAEKEPDHHARLHARIAISRIQEALKTQ